MNQQYKFEMQNKIQESRNIEELIQILEEIKNNIAQEEDTRDAYDLIASVCHALRVLTRKDPDQGKHLIVTVLLPYFEQDAEVPSGLRSDLSLLEDCLVSWIDQYEPTEQTPLRMYVLDHLLQKLQTSPYFGLCWAISSIGYRRQDIVDTLWNILEKKQDRLGDTALSTLTALGIPQDQRPLILDELHRRAASRINVPLIAVMTRLADSSSIAVLQHSWLSHSSSLGLMERSLVLSTLTAIAEMHPLSFSLQETIWQHLVEFYQQDTNIAFDLYLSDSIAPYCNNEQVVPDLLHWILTEIGSTEAAMHHRLLLSYRLEKCIRPRQVKSWLKIDNRTAIHDVLRLDACQDTHADGRWATHEMHSKQAAWKTVLYLGDTSVLSWFHDAVVKETNPYLQQQICDLLACFCFDPLPSEVIQWLTESYNYTSSSSSSELVARLGALRLTWSAASREAFHTLLACNLLVDGEMLRDTVIALRDVAFQLVHSGDDFVLPVLLETAISHPEQPRRIAAMSVLEFLAAENVLPSQCVHQLVQVLLQPQQRDKLEQRLLISLLGLVTKDALPDDAVEYVFQIATSHNGLENQALCALARQDYLISQEELLNQLGLTWNGTQWQLPLDAKSFGGNIKSQVLSLLYLHHPNEFSAALASVIKTAHWATVVGILWLLEETHLGSIRQPVPPAIADSLIERIKQNQTQTTSELGIFHVASRLIPERIAKEPWYKIWSEWLPDARVALADALGEAMSLTSSARKKAEELLHRLTGDGQYVVRRSAYRGLASQQPTMLLTLCLSWQQATSTELRQRAAEAWAWLPFDTIYTNAADTLYQTLVADVASSVREIAERVRKERWRRLWAQEYFPYIQRVIDSQQTNQDVFSAWCYAQALTHVGDDTIIAQLHTCLNTMSLRPHIRYWLQYILKETKENWQKAIRKWPQPWRMWQGAIEEGQGWLLLADGGQVPIDYALWYEFAPTASQTSEWGGTIHLSSSMSLIDTWQVNILLADGRQGNALVRSSKLSQGSLIVQGQGSFTSAVQTDE